MGERSSTDKSLRNTPKRRLAARDHEFRIDDQVASLYGGAVHYWRLDREKWDTILDRVKGMGFTTISSYIPWEVHEVEKGSFDFGSRNPSNDIDAFLTLVHRKGLRAIVRPGPQINSELTWFGYPRRILEDPELQARSAQGSKAVLTQVPRPIPALSYAAEKFFSETAEWYDAICPILARHRYPQGCLVAMQVDNEMAFFFHVNPYACDYSAASLERYRVFLLEKYGSLDALGAAYGRRFAEPGEIDPPRRFEGASRADIPYYTDWIEYRERYLVDSLGRLAGMLRARGFSEIPMFHNYPHPLGPGGAVSGITTPFNLPALEEELDFVGFDIYSRKELYDHVKTVVSYVVGTSRFPYIPEFIAGVWPWYLHPGGLQDEEFVTKAALMHGIKGFSRYMIVERDRWLASPVRRDGRVRAEDCAMFARVNAVAEQHRFVHLQRQADVLLLANRDYDRLEAAGVLLSFPGDFLETLLGFSEYPNFMTVSESTLGFAQAIQLAKSDFFAKWYDGLTRAGFGFVIGDSALPLERLRQHKVVVVSSFEYMNAALQRKLVAFARDGGTVVLGPELPRLDERMRNDETIASALDDAELLQEGGPESGSVYRLDKGRIVQVTGTSRPAETLEAVLGELALVRATKNDARLDVTLHRDRDQPQRLVVFVANPSAEPIDAQVSLHQPVRSILELWDGRSVPVLGDGQSWADRLGPFTITMYECQL